MEQLSNRQVVGYRLQVQHLAVPATDLLQAAGVCGLQNSPPGAWETAAFLRLPGLSRSQAVQALEEEHTLLQAWSLRGAPYVFPAGDVPVFLYGLLPEEGESWVYTDGIGLVLDWMDMSFGELLALTERAVSLLDAQTVESKAALDAALAQRIAPWLPQEKQARWEAPSVYGPNQTMGGAAVSFLLRPCALQGRVVFGARRGSSPTFVSLKRWNGSWPDRDLADPAGLARRFVHSYGPATPAMLASWAGCSPEQARRLWGLLEEELCPVQVEGRRRWVLAQDLPALHQAGADEERVWLLGPHDPYLDLRDRESILPEKALQRQVWRTVSNPGAVLLGGRIGGIWTGRTAGGKWSLTVRLWQEPEMALWRRIEQLAQELAVFRGLELQRLQVQGL